MPAESSSVAAAIRSSIFCWRLPEILAAAGLRCWTVAADRGGIEWSAGRFPIVRVDARADVFIKDFGPLAAAAGAPGGPAPFWDAVASFGRCRTVIGRAAFCPEGSVVL